MKWTSSRGVAPVLYLLLAMSGIYGSVFSQAQAQSESEPQAGIEELIILHTTGEVSRISGNPMSQAEAQFESVSQAGIKELIILHSTGEVSRISRSAVPQSGAPSERASQAEINELKKDLKGINREITDIKNQLQVLQQLLSQRPTQDQPPAPVQKNIAELDNPVLGKPDAPVTLIEFSDYDCPFCARFFRQTLPSLKAEFIDTGKLRYVFRDFPLDSLHPQARKAAEAAHCAGDQGKYWEMHDLLFDNQRALGIEQLKTYARRLNLDATVFDRCLDQGTYAAEIQRDYTEGVAAGIRGTPGFFLGKTTGDGVIQGTLISGAQPISAFRQAIFF